MEKQDHELRDMLRAIMGDEFSEVEAEVSKTDLSLETFVRTALRNRLLIVKHGRFMLKVTMDLVDFARAHR